MGALGWGKPETDRDERRNSLRRKRQCPLQSKEEMVRVRERERDGFRNKVFWCICMQSHFYSFMDSESSILLLFSFFLLLKHEPIFSGSFLNVLICIHWTYCVLESAVPLYSFLLRSLLYTDHFHPSNSGFTIFLIQSVKVVGPTMEVEAVPEIFRAVCDSDLLTGLHLSMPLALGGGGQVRPCLRKRARCSRSSPQATRKGQLKRKYV